MHFFFCFFFTIIYCKPQLNVRKGWKKTDTTQTLSTLYLRKNGSNKEAKLVLFLTDLSSANSILCNSSLFPQPLSLSLSLFPSCSTQIDASCLTWEGQQFQGKRAIVEKLASLPFTKIAHSITAQDHQPTPDCCILSMVVGQLKADDDPIMGFHQSFILKNINDAWVCTNDMFRLAIHNFG